MSAFAPAFTREWYEIEKFVIIHDLTFRKLAEYNSIVHIHKKMEFFENFKAFLDHYVKLKVRLRTFFSSIRTFKAERRAALAQESQS